MGRGRKWRQIGVESVKPRVRRQRCGGIARCSERVVRRRIEKEGFLVKAETRAATDAIVEHSPTEANSGFALAKNASQQSAAERGVIRQAEARPKIGVIRIVVAACAVGGTTEVITH